MIDFAALPPEINSARMYSGPGAAPLLDAAAAWSALATELTETSTEFRSTVTGLAAAWIGPSASAMTHSATSYVQWLASSALSAERTAVQAGIAASAYETAFAATVPPAEVLHNRIELATLVSTNILGQNTAAIMATEAAYAEMWAQDVAAMTAYSAESAAATTALPQLTQAPQVTNPAATVSNPILQFIQTLIPGFTVGQPLQNLGLLLTSPLSTSFLSSGPYQAVTEILALFTVLWGINSPSSPLAQAITNRITNTPIEIPPVTTRMPPPETTRAAIKAGMADGEKVGHLSVPPGWAQQTKPNDVIAGQRVAGKPLALGESPGLAGLAGAGGLGGLAGMRGTPTKQQRPEPQYGTASTVMHKHPYGG